MNDMDQHTEVTVKYDNGIEGFGWYVWETEYPDEGIVHFSETKPSSADLKAICPSYIEVN